MAPIFHSLQQIPLRLETVHYELIDGFPFPRMRYNMISFFDLYNIEDFVTDLFMISTFPLKPGGESRDPTYGELILNLK